MFMRNGLKRVIIADPNSSCWAFANSVYQEIKKIEEKEKLGIDFELAEVEIRKFPDGEFEAEIHANSRGRHIILIHDSSKDPAQWWTEVMLINDAARRGSAEKIINVFPYMRWSRGEKKDKSHIGIPTKVFLDTIGSLYSSARADRIITLDLHASAVQGFVNIPSDPLKSYPYVIREILEQYPDIDVIASPDVGSTKRARDFIEKTKLILEAKGESREIDLAIVDKRRVSGSETKAGYVMGEVKGKNVLLVDDILSSASTLKGARDSLLKSGAEKVKAYATHFVGAGNYQENLSDFGEVFTTNTFYQPKDRVPENVKVLDVSPLFARAIYEAERGGSISKLFGD